MNKNGHIRVSRCIVVIVTAINHADLKVIFNAEILLLKSKNKLVWFSSEYEPIEMKFHQEVTPLLKFTKRDVHVF